MKHCRILIIGGGIGGLTSAIALRRDGHAVDVIERDPDWAVYGVGIIQQANVIRAMAELGLVDDYLDASFAFDEVEVYLPSGQLAATIPSERLVEGYPANVGIARPALHKILGDRTIASGANVRLGFTATRIADGATATSVDFSDGSSAAYDIVIGADGVRSATRAMLFPEAPEPEFTGQSVWRYNFKRTPDVTCLQAYEGAIGVGLVPLSDTLMYMYVTTPEPGNPRYPTHGLAAAMRGKLVNHPPAIARLLPHISDDEAVVYKPLEWLFLTGAWHKGRTVLIGDAIHATTPHLGQGAGMAIEDSIVLAQEIARHESPDAAFRAFHDRRFDRCRYIVEASLSMCRSQLGTGPAVEQLTLVRAMTEVVAAPI